MKWGRGGRESVGRPWADRLRLVDHAYRRGGGHFGTLRPWIGARVSTAKQDPGQRPQRACRVLSPGLMVRSLCMATTTKVTLSVDSVALSLAQRAAELEGVSVSAVVSRVLRRHLLTDYGPSARPDTGADRQHDEDQAAAELDLAEQAARLDHDRGERRAAG